MAGLQLLAFRYHRLYNNPIMLGINIHLLLITPLIMITQWAGAAGLSESLLLHSYHGVLMTGLAVIWEFAFAESALVAVAIPLAVLFGLRRLLIARICDGTGSANSAVAVGAGSAVWTGAGTDEA